MQPEITQFEPQGSSAVLELQHPPIEGIAWPLTVSASAKGKNFEFNVAVDG